MRGALGANERQIIYERLLQRNFIRRALGLRALDVPQLYRKKIAQAEYQSRHGATQRERKPFLTNIKTLTQADLEPTEVERAAIFAKLVAQNLDRAAQGLAPRDVQQHAELAFAGHRTRAYQRLLSHYLDATLADIHKTNGGGPAPEDYRAAVSKAQGQLRDAMGIEPPPSKLGNAVAKLLGHKQIVKPDDQEAGNAATPLHTAE